MNALTPITPRSRIRAWRAERSPSAPASRLEGIALAERVFSGVLSRPRRTETRTLYRPGKRPVIVVLMRKRDDFRRAIRRAAS